MLVNHKVVVFDLDDTLYKEEYFVKPAFRYIAHRLHWARPSVTRDAVFDTLWSSILQNRDPFGEVICQFQLRAYKKDDLQDWYNNFKPSIALEDDVKFTLNILRDQGVIIGLITHGFFETQMNKIKALGLTAYISSSNIIIENVSKKNKRKNKSFRQFMGKYGKDYEYYYVGDNTFKDFHSPNILGWKTFCLLDDGRNIHHQEFNLPDEKLPQVRLVNIRDIISAIRYDVVTGSPLDLGKTVKRYGLDDSQTEILIAFDSFIWRDHEINTVNDIVNFEKDYSQYCNEFGFVYDSEIDEFGSIEMKDGPACLLCRKRFLQLSKNIELPDYGQRFKKEGLNLLEVLILRTFLADLSEMYRLDAYYYGLPPFVKRICDILNNALLKLPVYNEWVVRKCNEYDNVNFVKDDLFSPGFCLTTSADTTWTDKSENRYRIKPLEDGLSKARAIFQIIDNPEKQVSFLQNAMFRITAINFWGNNKKEIVMVEI